jgi:hypothetical protein
LTLNYLSRSNAGLRHLYKHPIHNQSINQSTQSGLLDSKSVRQDCIWQLVAVIHNQNITQRILHLDFAMNQKSS